MKVRTRILVGISLCAAFSLGSAPADAQTVIINEIHYHPADGSSSGEFVELYNYGERAVDIAGWLLGGAVTYVFPPETTIAADNYLVIARDADLLADRYDL